MLKDKRLAFWTQKEGFQNDLCDVCNGVEQSDIKLPKLLKE
jgi:hypothetical protein